MTPTSPDGEATPADPAAILTVDDLLPKLRLNVCTLVEAGQIAAAIEALQDTCAGLEIDLKNSGHDNDNLRLEKEAAEARVAALAGVLSELLRWHRGQEPSTNEPPGALIGDGYSVLAATPADVIERARAVETACVLLGKHHEHHLQKGTIGLPDGKGGWIEIDNAAEYSDSSLYERTVEALAKLDTLGKEGA